MTRRKAPPNKTLTKTTAAFENGFTLHNYQTGYCLGVRAGTPTIGNGFVVWECDNSANQSFLIRTTGFAPSPDLEIMSLVADDRCMDAVPSLNRCLGYDFNMDVPWDDWKLIPMIFNDRQCYNIETRNSPGFVLAVSAGRTDEGAPVIVWPNFHDPVRHPDQIWCL